MELSCIVAGSRKKAIMAAEFEVQKVPVDGSRNWLPLSANRD
jgi:hypothetical protein